MPRDVLQDAARHNRCDGGRNFAPSGDESTEGGKRSGLGSKGLAYCIRVADPAGPVAKRREVEDGSLGREVNPTIALPMVGVDLGGGEVSGAAMGLDLHKYGPGVIPQSPWLLNALLPK